MKNVLADQVKNSNTVTDATFKLSKTKNYSEQTLQKAYPPFNHFAFQL